ncbi:uncharacterized protein LOC106077583 [Biomphalaria glabrata]|uniref:Uncharacterized protein LOC106077583 n=1 Tax=Biomphalaria glabrata TaxID=6526 RepID=A0A9U8ELN0_BIOGL|nr:uncharacterized protein LOC106077583 [Biomphalaria glabrata]XP_013093764.2 uncharacterized protein LOC106077583 [Biomphalaria glabrata]XP_055896544.1 uncharacterized protein LOC106077583 [Biomphalaria glabrata]XP_055896545.1 uncharacterized protein LOC106077583 [Biomphalaria glabrata]XP_055896546.1 uncharacterized protein LOC106077583 [Biomphalaria glabrata]XP_055896547.1 uncharacterized protein LOC106077583 [Biomphalaria glabrata]
MPKLLYGLQETQDVEDFENDPEANEKSCQKNPGHASFHLVNEFTMNHLPEKYKNENFHECILQLAKLVIKLSVGKVSPERPKEWPVTQQPYPYYGCQRKLRMGTARVEQVIQHLDGKRVCECQKCKTSACPKKLWGEIEVYTAAHVIFDQTEADDTTWTLFDDAIKLSAGLVIDTCDVRKDLCKMKFITCDTGLVNQLADIMAEYIRLWDIVYSTWKSTWDEDKVAVIVSHPHGGFKKISVGQWRELEERDDLKGKRFSYTTSTCPGSSGAYVFIPGYNTGSWYTGFDQLIHSGTDGQINFSAFGIFLDSK